MCLSVRASKLIKWPFYILGKNTGSLFIQLQLFRPDSLILFFSIKTNPLPSKYFFNFTLNSSRTLHIVYNDFNKSYDELLELNNDLSIHQRHLPHYAIEVFKSIRNLNPKFMWPYLEEKPMFYNLRDGSKLVLPKTKSSHFGSNLLQFRETFLWINIPVSLKSCI